MGVPDAEFDIFVSHAHEDKARLEPLIKALDRIGIIYWLDNLAIGWGESIVQRISEGLVRSRYVVVIITENFLNKNWTMRELNYAITKEIDGYEITVLPVIDVEKSTIIQKLPLLADKSFIRLEIGHDAIADKIGNLLGREFAEEWSFSHPATYVGDVWISIQRMKGNAVPHRCRVIWGPWTRELTLDFEDETPIVLRHYKGSDGLSIPLKVSVRPKCFVRVGHGKPRSDKIINIDRG